MKKFIIAVLVGLFVSGVVFAGGEKETASSQKTYKIGFARILDGETWEQQKAYLEDEVGPSIGATYVFSEKIQDANGLRDFMEQCYAAGCDAIVNAFTDLNACSMAARLCEDWGLYYMSNNSAIAKDVSTLSHNLGHLGASPEGSKDAYKAALAHVLADGKNHSLYIFSGAAVGGATGTGAASHYYATYGMLEAMQEHYGLTYKKSIDEIVNTQTPGEVETGNPNVKIYVYAGFTDIPGAIKSVQTQLQNGPYDIFSCVTMFATFSNAIDSVEKATGKDIKFITTASVEKQTATGFATLDSTGHSVLDVAIINPTQTSIGWVSAVLVQGIKGNGAKFKNADGTVIFYEKNPWVVTSAAAYENIAKLDIGPGSYVIDGAELSKVIDATSLKASIAYSDDLDLILKTRLGIEN